MNRISHPGCCARLCGYDYSIATPSDIEKLENEMPKDFMTGNRILKKQSRGLCCKSCYNTKTHKESLCFEAGIWSLFGLIPVGTGGFTLFLGGIVTNGMPAVLIAGGAQCGATALFEVGLWSYAGIRSCFCYDTQEYTFGANVDIDQEEVNFSSSDSSSSE